MAVFLSITLFPYIKVRYNRTLVKTIFPGRRMDNTGWDEDHSLLGVARDVALPQRMNHGVIT
jgi:hypothetical protein